MKKIFITVIGLILCVSMLKAQNDTMYVMKAGKVINKQSIKFADVDSIIYYKPLKELLNTTHYVARVFIPAGSFVNSSGITVNISAFRMSRYEITNEQFAAFLNAKGIGSNGLYVDGAYPTEVLILANASYGLTYNGTQWVAVSGCETLPVINVSWFGATEFASFMGGTLPTEAQWEYACKAGTTSDFNTGNNCLTINDANYQWAQTYSTCSVAVTNSSKPSKVGFYPANAFGLFDMHGNAYEWCSDWYGAYLAGNLNNPTGPTQGTERVVRGGSWASNVGNCRSNLRRGMAPSTIGTAFGFRMAFVQ